MHVAHIGPPLSQRGGPAGYLRQLQAAVDAQQADAGSDAIRVTFPQPAGPRPEGAHPVPPSFLRRLGRRIRRQMRGEPRQYRPTRDEAQKLGGPILAMLANAHAATLEEALVSLTDEARSADVLFAHDPWTAEALVARCLPHQKVWLFVHTPMPLGLYVAWCWGLPEWTWQDVMALPDVVTDTQEEVATWRSVDRLVFPCEEARAEFGRIDPAFLTVETTTSQVLTGARAPDGPTPERQAGADRARWGLPTDRPVGLFIGNDQPYRGLDAVAAGLASIGDGTDDQNPGVIAVAGPAVERVPEHPRLLPLGRVSDVGSLLASVDFVINANRFSLFDLSLVEALEAGKPLVLHQTGGNRVFESLGAGVMPLHDLAPPAMADALVRAFSCTPQERERLGAASRGCYEEHLTFDSFARGHLALYDQARIVGKNQDV